MDQNFSQFQVAKSCTVPPWARIAKAFNLLLGLSRDDFDLVLDLNFSYYYAYVTIDDIGDSGLVREGKPCYYRIHGVPITIANSLKLHFVVLKKCLEMKEGRRAAKMLITTMLEQYRGQQMEIYWAHNLICPTEKEYLLMSSLKGIALLMSFRMMQIFSDNKKDFTKFIELFITYCVVDNDYINFKCNNIVGKTFADDVTEGKFSFLIIHAITSHPEYKDELLNILKLKTDDIKIKKHFASILEKCGSFQYAEKRLQELKRNLCQELIDLGEDPKMFRKSLDNIHI